MYFFFMKQAESWGRLLFKEILNAYFFMTYVRIMMLDKERKASQQKLSHYSLILFIFSHLKWREVWYLHGFGVSSGYKCLDDINIMQNRLGIGVPCLMIFLHPTIDHLEGALTVSCDFCISKLVGMKMTIGWLETASKNLGSENRQCGRVHRCF